MYEPLVVRSRKIRRVRDGKGSRKRGEIKSNVGIASGNDKAALPIDYSFCVGGILAAKLAAS